MHKSIKTSSLVASSSSPSKASPIDAAQSHSSSIPGGDRFETSAATVLRWFATRARAKGEERRELKSERYEEIEESVGEDPY